MNTDSYADDDHLDQLWRERFGQPLPIRGCSALARVLLGEPPRRDLPAADPAE